MNDVFRVCEMCGANFLGKPNQIYCSHECYKIARTKNMESYADFRKKKFERLIDYVQRNNLKLYLKQFMPTESKRKMAK